MFRVVADQLKISDGWVRCGHCADVFDATLYLETWVPPAPVNGRSTEPVTEQDHIELDPVPDPGLAPPSEVQHSQPHRSDESLAPAGPERAPDDGPVAQSESLQALDDEDDAGDWLSAPVPLDPVEDTVEPAQEPVEFASRLEASVPTVSSEEWSQPVQLDSPTTSPDMLAEEPVSARAAESSESDDFQAELAQFAAESGHHSETTPLPLVAPEADAADSEPLAAAAPPEPVPQAETEPGQVQAEPGFVRLARRRAFWRSPAMRVALSLVALTLVALLLAQWAVHERDRLAARHPALAPLLAQLCEPLGCRVGAARHIESIVIDSTALVRRLGNFHSFDLVLKNTAPMPLALPALELSLTDTGDEVIARRVFLPHELPGAPAVLPAHGTVAISLRLSLAVGESLPMAGYRALVFYP